MVMLPFSTLSVLVAPKTGALRSRESMRYDKRECNRSAVPAARHLPAKHPIFRTYVPSRKTSLFTGRLAQTCLNCGPILTTSRQLKIGLLCRRMLAARHSTSILAPQKKASVLTFYTLARYSPGEQ
jgi:hypothetical protein